MADKLHPGGQCEDINKIMTLLPEYVKRLEKVEGIVEDHDKTISELAASHRETKVYVKMILEKLDGMEGKLFDYIKQAMRDATKERINERQLDHEERKDGSQERIKTTAQYTGLIKYVVGATIGALIAGVVAYIKIQGGK